MDRCELLAFCLSIVAGGAAATAATGPPAGVSPGAAASFELAAACPTFSWTAVPDAAGYELVVYDADAQRPRPSLEARLPAGATSWTPAADRCLAAGHRYGWSVRATSTTARVGSDWSEALLFEIAETPSAADLQRAIEVVQRYLGTAQVGEQTLGKAEADTLPTRAVAAAEEPRPQREGDETQSAPAGGGPATAVRGEVPDAAGETYGVRGVSNSAAGAGVRADNNNAAGADLMLGGSPVATVTETTFSRNSAGNLTFNFTNPGAGSMTVQADGSNLVTAAAGSALWVDQAGDTMAGTLSMGGNPLTNVGDVALNTASTVTKAGQRFLFDDGSSFAAGRGALAGNTGLGGTAVGTGALAANTSGNFNTAVGIGALDANTTGTYNVAVGDFALSSSTTGGGNVAIGDYAMLNNTTGSINTAIGQYALRVNTTGSGHVAVGHSALSANTATGANVAVGLSALGLNTTGFYQTAVGSLALGNNTTGARNQAFGDYALRNNTTGNNNTAIGQYALNGNTTGSYNIALGNGAGVYATTGSSNIFIGHAGVAGESSRIRIGSGQTATYVAGISGATTAGGIAVLVNGSGKLGTIVSSRRFKEDIEAVGEEAEALFDLRPVSFRYTEEAAGPGERPVEYGLIAEEVAEVFPELVAYDEEGRPWTVRYHLLVPLLLAEVQHERERAEALARRIEALERRRGRDRGDR